MKFAAVRHTLFTIHMWVGLSLGLLCAALGLSGSLLVYDDAVNAVLNPPPFATTAGAPLPLAMIAGAARDAARDKGVTPGQLQISLPQKPTQAVAVRVGDISPMGAGGVPRRGRGLQVFVDPISGQILDTRTEIGAGIVRFAHQLHGNFLMGRDGRRIVVGGLGLAMLALGASGLVLWWPRLSLWKTSQWKHAFFIRRTAQGLRFHRELHAAAGIWIFVIFMIVSYSGLVLAWPGWLGPARAPAVPHLTAGTSAPIGPDRALLLARDAMPGATPTSVTIPAAFTQPITVGFLAHDAVRASVLVDPWTDKVIGVRDNSGSLLAWMRPLHQGTGLGGIYRFLVFLSGLVPTLFVVTGVIMWVKKRRRHVPMTATFEEIDDGPEGSMA